MAKKLPEIVDDSTPFSPTIGAQKMPVNITRGNTARTDYIDAPVNQIVPFTLKGNDDFTKVEGPAFDQIVGSVKEDGVIEAVTLRPYVDGQWELLAGETRWRAARMAGLRTIPAHVLRECDDERAKRIFSITNVARRDATIMDKINGWWMYWENTKKKPGRKAQQDVKDDIAEAGEERTLGGITVRQIVKYHKVHSLEPALLKSIAAGQIHLEAAYSLTFLDPDERAYLISTYAKPSNSQAGQLKELSQSGHWNEKEVDIILGRQKRRDSYDPQMKYAIKHIKKIVSAKVNPEKYKEVPDIIDKALSEYLENHPEYKKAE